MVSSTEAALELRAHLMSAAMTGTAIHLFEAHKIDPENIDLDDAEGMIVDHAHLHGVKTDAAGNLAYPTEEG